MRLHDERARELLEHEVGVAEVVRRLQHPALGALARSPLLPLQELEELSEVAIRRALIVRVEPAPVRRHVRARLRHGAENECSRSRISSSAASASSGWIAASAGDAVEHRLHLGLRLRDARIAGPLAAAPGNGAG